MAIPVNELDDLVSLERAETVLLARNLSNFF
jgi:hypothetical protein